MLDHGNDPQYNISIFFFACWVIFALLLSSADLFQNNNFRNTIRESNGLDPDQDRRSVGPDLGPNCLQGRSSH